jgi:hypothetical protein
MAHFGATLEIGGFDNATEAAKFVRACGFNLRAPTPDPTRVIGTKIMARHVDVIGTVVMLRKGVTLRFDMLKPNTAMYVPRILAQLANKQGDD